MVAINTSVSSLVLGCLAVIIQGVKDSLFTTAREAFLNLW